jgi:hypothetical protein
MDLALRVVLFRCTRAGGRGRGDDRTQGPIPRLLLYFGPEGFGRELTHLSMSAGSMPARFGTPKITAGFSKAAGRETAVVAVTWRALQRARA